MEYLKTKMQQEPLSWWMEILIWVKDNAIIWATVALGWKAIDKGFKYLKEGREAEIRAIVKDEITRNVNHELERLAGTIDKLADKVVNLGDSVFELRNKL